MNKNNSQEKFILEEKYQPLELPGLQKSHPKIEVTENNIFEYNLYGERDEEIFQGILGYSNNKYDSNSEYNDDDNSRFYTKTNTAPKKKKIFQLKKVQRIFSIRKRDRNERKKGRLPLNRRPLNIPKHNKNSLDNIATKIKAHFVKKTLKYVNKKFNEFLLRNNRKKKTLLMNIKPDSYKKFSKKANQNFINLKIHQLFSADLTNRIREFPKYYNRTQIKSLFEKNEAIEVIEIMNSSVKEMYEIYSSNKITDYNLESDLKETAEKNGKEKEHDSNSNEEGIDEGSENEKEEKGEEEGKDYKDKYKNTAEKLIDLLNGKIKRKDL
jgi:hypothetical protein